MVKMYILYDSAHIKFKTRQNYSVLPDIKIVISYQPGELITRIQHKTVSGVLIIISQ